MQIARVFTVSGQDVFSQIKWVRRTALIKGEGGVEVFRMEGVEVPDFWSQSAAEILASKYFRKAGVPQRAADREYLTAEIGLAEDVIAVDGLLCWNSKVQTPMHGPERSLKQVVHRIVLGWKNWGLKNGYFTDPVVPAADSAQAFYDEMVYMMIHQMGAPNSPQWFNGGLADAYGITGLPAQGAYCADHTLGSVCPVQDSYSRPALSACFIMPVEDRLIGDGGIMDLWQREALIFKYGGGSGTNVSKLRGAGEPLSSGGVSSGLMSWLKIGDAAAGAVKSGGTTRRSAKMVVLDADHPDIFDFVRLKAREELKVRAMVNGHELLMGQDPEYRAYAERVGLTLGFDFNGEAYHSVNGQNANYSVRLSEDFMLRTENRGQWQTRQRTDQKVTKTFRASELLDEIADAAWRCADPGVQFDTTINEWHTVPQSGRQNASNPCSEHICLDNTACNLASINLLKFWDADNRSFNMPQFSHAAGLWTLALELTVGLASYPSEDVASTTYAHRPLGLGYANLGALLMRIGVPYDSAEGRTIAATVSSLMLARSYTMSSMIAAEQGPFSAYERNKTDMLRVVHNHANAAIGNRKALAGLSVEPLTLDHDALRALPLWNGDAVSRAVVSAWETALSFGHRHGFRNCQAVVIAPTGTIAFVMDCDTTGVEPDFALVKYKKLSDGGFMTIVNESVAPALKGLGYEPTVVEAIRGYVLMNGTIEGAPGLKSEHLPMFDCANRCGEKGKRFIRPMAHVEMLAAVQPFVSGAISKTINMPNDATIGDVRNVYVQAWKMGVKCLAVYRDNSKRSQPLNSKATKPAAVRPTSDVSTEESLRRQVDELMKNVAVPRLQRRRLPDDCLSIRHKFQIGNHEGYIHVGLYQMNPPVPGEVFIRMNKEGTMIAGLAESFAICLSMLIQYGVPLDTVVHKFMHQRFEPNGPTAHPDIPFAKSLVDYVARWMGIEFIPGFRDIHGPSRDTGHANPPGAVVNLDRPEPVPAARWFLGASQPQSEGMAYVGRYVGPQGMQAGVMQADNPACSKCGSQTIRSGVCVRCPNCGEAAGCG